KTPSGRDNHLPKEWGNAMACPYSLQMPQLASNRRTAPLLLLIFLASPLPAAERTRAEARDLTQKVLGEAIIIDTHADTPQMMLDEGYDLADPSSPYMISIPKMRTGHEGAQFFSIWVD